MKKLLTILSLFICCAVRADEIVKRWELDGDQFWISMHESPDGAKHYTQFTDLSGTGAAPMATRYWTNYTWNSATTNILINSTNYPSAGPGDTIFIPFRTNGYRSFTIQNIGLVSWGNYLTIMWASNAQIAPSTSSITANSLGNINWIMVDGMKMYDHPDVAFTTYRGSNFSHRVYWKNCIFRGIGGFFYTANPTGSTNADYTGGSDTTNCYYGWTWDNCRWDSANLNISLGKQNPGQTALWFGAIDKKEAWVRTEIKNCYFGHYRSPRGTESGGPATFIRASNVWGLYIHHNQFEELGLIQDSMKGHAAQIYIFMCYWEAYNNKFGPNNFGNCIRNYGSSGVLYDASLLSQWSIAFDGYSRFYSNLDIQSIKYPCYEEVTNSTTMGYATTLGYCRYVQTAKVMYNTFWRIGTGINQDPYITSIFDKYSPGSTDTIFCKYNVFVGPADTAWNACNFGTLPLKQGCNKLYNVGSGTVSRWDTIGNVFEESATVAGLDTVTLNPIKGVNQIFGKAAAPPPYITTDYYGNSRTQGRETDKGAVQYPEGYQLKRCRGCKIKFQ